MPALARLLQHEFSRALPAGWHATPEALVVEDRRLLDRLGYEARADLLLERDDGKRRLWVELEISRADPVANHAKFATAHLFRPFDAHETFVAMVSPHVTRGRRNLAANAIELMRRVGMNAFQLPLLPRVAPDEIKRLNHLPSESLARAGIDVRLEIERLFSTVEPAFDESGHRIHFAPDPFDVMLNVDAWNRQIASPEGSALWKRRTVTYFVFDATARVFAPAKFCAFVPVGTGDAAGRTMTMPLYARLDESEPRFDGHRARVHLEERLAMKLVRRGESPLHDEAFDAWHTLVHGAVGLHPAGPAYLVAPDWF